MSYDHVSSNYSAFITTFTSITKPTTYVDVAKDQSLIDSIQTKINA